MISWKKYLKLFANNICFTRKYTKVFRFTSIGNEGRWWGSNPVKKRQEEIDIMAIQEPYVLLGECKWKNAPVDMDTVHTLLERGGLFHYPEKYYFFFSKSGFVDSVIDYVKDSRYINIVSYKQICQIGDINE